MSEIPDNTIQCVVTSPPYWGLRKYAGTQDLIWGGDNHCEHEWISEKKAIEYIQGNPEFARPHRELKSFNAITNTCQTCGAWRGQFGLEPTPEMYVEHTIEILREIRRVLRKDGVVFWNIGDSYVGSTSQHKGNQSQGHNSVIAKGTYGAVPDTGRKERVKNLVINGLKPKDLCLIPFRIAIATQEDGWWVRSVIIWSKPNPMPESINGWRWEQHRVSMFPDGRLYKHKKGKDRPAEVEMKDCPGCSKCSPNDGLVLRKGSWRPTDSYEQILMLTKTSSYYCDAEVVRENLQANTIERDRIPRGRSQNGGGSEKSTAGYDYSDKSLGDMQSNPNGRNIRSVWEFPTQPYPEAHFAVFPEKLPELCIKAATPEQGCCAKCGAPWARNLENKPMEIRRTDWGVKAGNRTASSGTMLSPAETKTIGWKPGCKCNSDSQSVPSLVLDPFAGAGTTLKVAAKLNRKAIGYEISEEYCKLIEKRNMQQVGL